MADCRCLMDIRDSLAISEVFLSENASLKLNESHGRDDASEKVEETEAATQTYRTGNGLL